MPKALNNGNNLWLLLLSLCDCHDAIVAIVAIIVIFSHILTVRMPCAVVPGTSSAHHHSLHASKHIHATARSCSCSCSCSRSREQALWRDKANIPRILYWTWNTHVPFLSAIIFLASCVVCFTLLFVVRCLLEYVTNITNSVSNIIILCCLNL